MLKPSIIFAVALLPIGGCVNLHTVVDGQFYRSGQPDEERMKSWVWRYQIETVLRVRNSSYEDETFQATYQPTVAAGIDFIAVPLSAKRFPERESLVRLCEVLETARYPMLVHCRAGADRTGLVSAIYVLSRTGDLDRARDQLSFVPYLHLGWFGLDKPDLILEMYEPWYPKMTFYDWARTVYEKPPNDELPDDYIATQRQRAASSGAKAKGKMIRLDP